MQPKHFDPDIIVPLELLDVYTDDSKLDSSVGSGIWIWLSHYLRVFHTKVMAIYGTAQRILVIGIPLIRISIFPDSQAFGIKAITPTYVVT